MNRSDILKIIASIVPISVGLFFLIRVVSAKPSQKQTQKTGQPTQPTQGGQPTQPTITKPTITKPTTSVSVPYIKAENNLIRANGEVKIYVYVNNKPFSKDMGYYDIYINGNKYMKNSNPWFIINEEIISKVTGGYVGYTNTVFVTYKDKKSNEIVIYYLPYPTGGIIR